MQSEVCRNSLSDILDRLGPGLFLEVDHAWLGHAFNFRAVGSNVGPLEAAKNFAEDRECYFSYSPQTRRGEFGRAYFRDMPADPSD
jgi:hypothetical protein